MALSWQTTHKHGSNMPALQSHAFQIDAAMARSGAVRVEARAPSGRTMGLDVIDKNGVFTANFTPSEVGDWCISILYEGEHIQGSPFNVRVYDAAQVKVFGLEGGSVGKTFSFSADTSAAGDGKLTVDIKHNNRNVPVTMQDVGRGIYRVSFTPDGAGIYIIRVCFAGVEVAGSPYTLEIVDSSRVRATGEGLTCVEVNKRATFQVNARGAGGGDVKVAITSARGQNIPCQVFNNGDETYTVEYTAPEVGEYRVDVSYYNRPISGSPFTVQASDPSSIRIMNLPPIGKCGHSVEFDIDASRAGPGNLEIMVNDGTIPCQVQNKGNRMFHATFVPQSAMPHSIQLCFNGKPVPGSPWVVNVFKPAVLSVQTDTISAVPVGRRAGFDVFLEGGGSINPGDLTVNIITPSRRRIAASVSPGHNSFHVEFTPTETGTHTVEVCHEGHQAINSPFNVKVYNLGAIMIGKVPTACVGKAVEFPVDVTQAGEGQLEITVNGGSVPNSVKAIRKGVFMVQFVPRDTRPHVVDILFNGELVPGTPLNVPILDASKVTAEGDGLHNVAVNHRAHFHVDAQSAGDAELSVRVTSPSGKEVPVQISANRSGFDVQYTLTEAGTHRVDVEYGCVAVPGSPFYVKAYHPGNIRVSKVEDGIVGCKSSFSVDVSNAGEGSMEIAISSKQSTIPNHVRQLGPGQFEVSYTPTIGGEHTAVVSFNKEQVPGSPFVFMVIDPTQVTANGDGLDLVQVNKLASFTITAPDASVSDLSVKIDGPNGRDVHTRIRENGRGTFVVEYMPVCVGDHHITVKYKGIAICNSPFTSRAWDASAVVVKNIRSCKVGKSSNFNVDASRAGSGNLEIVVTVDDETVPNFVKSQGNAHFLVSFTPQVMDTHIVSVRFNCEPVPGSPFFCAIIDGTKATASGRGLEFALACEPAQFVIHRNGLDQAEVSVKITAPNGSVVPSKIVQQPDGDYKVEYSSRYTGRHTVEIMYCSQPIMGSPFYVEIYDPSKVYIECPKVGSVGEPIHFNIIRKDAGKAELGVTIQSPSGKSLRYEIRANADGDHVTYVPTESGPHQIFLTYGGLDVPGCPCTQVIQDVGTVTAHGDGLLKGCENQPASFLVDATGLHGELSVQADGPNSIAKCTINPRGNGTYLVSYIPVEVGQYAVHVRWNKREIAGSPFRPMIVDSTKVRVVGGWQSMMDAQGRVHLEVDKLKRIEFHCMDAGPGTLRGEVAGPDGHLETKIIKARDGVYVMSFTPRCEGEHHISVWWGECALPNSPYLGWACIGQLPINHEKVILTGRGLQEACIHRQAEFIIDGTEAGPGIPEVKMSGLRNDVDVKIQSLGDCKFRAVYVPTVPGAYLLNIAWSGHQVRGSPFKVNVLNTTDASKVTCSAEGLKVGILGKELKTIIDTRRAGPGELTAQCMGPTKVAYCDLFDHRDGTYTLSIKPQEAGRHVLQIKYGGEHVPGSPFVLRIQGGPDASKVRVFGPGVEHGILATYQSRFVCDTKGAGAGQLTVRIRGPKGAFRVEMQRENHKDRTIACRYDPTEVGDYVIHVKWSGEHVPGSPFHVQIFDTQEELERVAMDQRHGHYPPRY